MMVPDYLSLSDSTIYVVHESMPNPLFIILAFVHSSHPTWHGPTVLYQSCLDWRVRYLYDEPRTSLIIRDNETGYELARLQDNAKNEEITVKSFSVHRESHIGTQLHLDREVGHKVVKFAFGLLSLVCTSGLPFIRDVFRWRKNGSCAVSDRLFRSHGVLFGTLMTGSRPTSDPTTLVIKSPESCSVKATSGFS